MINWDGPLETDDDPLREFRRRNPTRPMTHSGSDRAWIYGAVILFLFAVCVSFFHS